MSALCGWWLSSALLKDWRGAQQALGLDDTAADNLEAVFAAYTWRKAARRYGGGRIQYVPCEKCASEEFSHRLQNWQNSAAVRDRGDVDKPICTVAWIRDPIARFGSAYREMEWRFAKGLELHGDAGMAPMTFHKHRLGSKERVQTFIKDLFAVHWLAPGHDIPKALNGALQVWRRTRNLEAPPPESHI